MEITGNCQLLQQLSAVSANSARLLLNLDINVDLITREPNQAAVQNGLISGRRCGYVVLADGWRFVILDLQSLWLVASLEHGYNSHSTPSNPPPESLPPASHSYWRSHRPTPKHAHSNPEKPAAI
jgi:hypothetical protein